MGKYRFKYIVLKLVKMIPGGKKLTILCEKLWLARFSSSQSLFEYYYKKNFWESNESLSGPGSTLLATKNIRVKLPVLMREKDFNSILDAPCGDFNWIKNVEWGKEVHYFGGDIVRSLIDVNNSKYAAENREFLVLDIVNDALPNVDVWLCRDCLFHFSSGDINAVFNNFLKSGIGFILTTSYPNVLKNTDIPTGSFRQLNLEIAPFNLSRPRYVINDHEESEPVRKLCLWSREDIRMSYDANSD